MHLKDPFYAFRESFKTVLGAPPDPSSLDPQILETVELDGYRREKVVYQVQPDEWAYAYVLTPTRFRGPFPAIFCHHRHNRDWSLGKSEVVGIAGDKNEAFGLELVKRGYVVLAPDAIAFEERRPAPLDEESDPTIRQLTDMYNNLRELSVRLLRGETLLKKIISDASKGIDYLLTRSEVDKNRIGFFGHGYGARMAMWTTAMDDRVKVAVAHGSIGSMHASLRLRHNIQIEFSVPRLLQVADYDRILSMAAPRPFLLSCSEDDSESSDAQEVYEKAARIYIKMGVANRLSLFRYPAYEGDPWFTPQARYHAYSWLDSWLKPY